MQVLVYFQIPRFDCHFNSHLSLSLRIADTLIRSHRLRLGLLLCIIGIVKVLNSIIIARLIVEILELVVQNPLLILGG